MGVSKMTNRLMTIKKEFSDEVKEQNAKLLDQKEKLKKFKKSIKSGIDDQSAMTSDTSMMEMISDILRATEEEELIMRIPEFVFDGDDVAVSDYISSIGKFGEPEPEPTMEIVRVGASSVSVKFQ